MRYKAMAKKLRQLVELDDPIPAEAVLTNEEELQNIGADENINESTNNYTSENFFAKGKGGKIPSTF